jgi:hypothetical protein
VGLQPWFNNGPTRSVARLHGRGPCTTPPWRSSAAATACQCRGGCVHSAQARMAARGARRRVRGATINEPSGSVDIKAMVSYRKTRPRTPSRPTPRSQPVLRLGNRLDRRPETFRSRATRSPRPDPPPTGRQLRAVPLTPPSPAVMGGGTTVGQDVCGTHPRLGADAARPGRAVACHPRPCSREHRYGAFPNAGQQYGKNRWQASPRSTPPSPRTCTPRARPAPGRPTTSG